MHMQGSELIKLPVIKVTGRQRDIVDKAVEKGYFPSASEFIRSCINRFEECHHVLGNEQGGVPA